MEVRLLGSMEDEEGEANENADGGSGDEEGGVEVDGGSGEGYAYNFGLPWAFNHPGAALWMGHAAGLGIGRWAGFL
ncbi:unnamed protein product [Prunus armeniaca]|uniref:Uncharacterized protein n=1 Tax=Prunus armeniaca TaxID=36596 RepID=A0A6J5VDR7_PRUAR|nr:unnamed protein product [Prunus armeniaca]